MSNIIKKSVFIKVGVLAIVLSFFINPSSAFAAQYGPIGGSTFVGNVASPSGDHDWSSASNVTSSNDSRATVTISDSNNVSNYLRVTGFGINIPVGSIINGITVSIERSEANTQPATIRDNVVSLVKNNTVVGQNKAATATNWPTSDAVANYGSGITDLWGSTWTRDEVVSPNFGVVLSVGRTSGGDEQARVDHITVTIYHTPAPVSITPISLTNGQVGSVYSQNVTASTTATGPFTWSVVSGALPAGLTLGTTGTTTTLSGTPTTVATSTFSVRVTNGTSSTTKSYTVGIIPSPSATVNVVSKIFNDDGTGTKSVGDFNISVTGANATPNSFVGSLGTTTITVDPNITYITSVTNPGTGYLISLSPNCSNNLPSGTIVTCTITIDDLPESDSDVNLIPNNSMESADTLPTTWLQSQWGNNVNVFTYPVLGSADSPTATTALAARVELTSHTDGDAKWYFNPVNVSSNSDYVFFERYRSNVSTRVVVAQIDINNNWTLTEAVPVAVISQDGWKKVAFEIHTLPSTKKLTVFHLIETIGWLEIDRAKLISDVPIAVTDLVPNNSVEQVSKADLTLPRGWFRGGWGTNSSTFTYVDGDAHNGNRSVKVEIGSYTTGDAKWYFAPQNLTQGADYRFTGWYKTNTIPHAVVQFTKSNGQVKFFGMPNPQPGATSETEWQEYSSEFSVPSDVVSVSVFFYIDEANSWVQVDDFHITPYSFTGFDRPIITLTFDDGFEDNVNTVLPKMNTLGLKSTQCYATQYIEGIPAQEARVLSFYNAGHEICAHTITHGDLTTLSFAQVENELVHSQDVLEGIIGSPVTTFASPFGAYNVTVNNQIASHYSNHRTVNEGFNSLDNLDLYELRVQNMGASTTLAEFQSWVNKAIEDKIWLIIVYHKIGIAPDIFDTAQTDFNTQMDWLAGITNYGNGLVNGKITVKTLKDAIAEVTGKMPPVIGVHADVVAEATSALGANVSFDLPTTTDDVDASVAVNCTPASGSTFTLSTSTVTCVATDSNENHATSTFSVIVRDTTAPVINVTGNANMEVPYGSTYIEQGATSTDAVDGEVSATVGGATVNTNSLGEAYIVTYNSTDSHGNVAEQKVRVVNVVEAPVDIQFTNLEQTYNGTSREVTVVTTPPDLAYTLTYDGSATAPTNAGNYSIAVIINEPNFEGSKNDTLIVNKAPLTVTANDESIVFGEPTPSFTFNYSGFENGETENVLTEEPVITIENPHTAVGVYVISISGGQDDNYSFVLNSGTFTITPIPSDVEFDAETLIQTYDGNPKSVTATSAFAYEVKYNGSSELPVNTGTYNVIATITEEGHTGEATGSLVINPAPIEVTIADNIKAFNADDPDPITTSSITNGTFFGDDTFLINTIDPREEGEAIGTYEITGVFTANANYEITINSGTFTIAVDPNNLPAVIESQTLSTYQNTALPIVLTATDDLGAELVWTIVNGTTHGILSGEAPSLTYTPDTDYAGGDFFTFTVNDGNSTSTLATVTISVNVEPTCPAGFNLVGNECVGEPTSGCSLGTTFNTESGLCESGDPTPFAPNQCENPFVFNSETNDCEAPNEAPVCPSGTDLVEGQCVTAPVPPVTPTCDVGIYNETTDQCENATTPVCAEGVLNPDNDMCEGESVTPAVPTCEEGTYDSTSNMCISATTATCSTGSLNTETNMCEVTVVPPFTPNECPVNFILNEGQCVAEPQEPTCPVEAPANEENMCVPGETAPVEPICPENSVSIEGGMCQPNPVTPICDADFNLEGNVCVAKIDVCPNIDGIQETVPEGKHIDGGQCVDDEAPVPTPARRGGGGGGRRINRPVATTTQAVGQVLGASTNATTSQFIFNIDLSLGMANNDVLELQKRLTGEGVYGGPLTGYFGQLTLAGVQAYQGKMGIVPISGYVGPMTRAKLNGGQVLGAINNDLKTFIELLITLGIIPADKAADTLKALGF